MDDVGIFGCEGQFDPENDGIDDGATAVVKVYFSAVVGDGFAVEIDGADCFDGVGDGAEFSAGIHADGSADGSGNSCHHFETGHALFCLMHDEAFHGCAGHDAEAVAGFAVAATILAMAVEG